MTTEERIQKEAESYSPDSVFLIYPSIRFAYISGAMAEATRSKELQVEVNRLMQFVGKCHALEIDMEILKEEAARNKENAVAFAKRIKYDDVDWGKSWSQLYDLFLNEQNKKV